MKKIIGKIFSIKNLNDKYKQFCFFGIKIKTKRKGLSEQKINELHQMLKDLNFKQDLIMDYYIDIKNSKKATGALKERQDEGLILLKEFKRICDKYDIPYWIDFGTLLGAKRHDGFIPWDDDVDVSMIHSDSIRFVEAFKKENSDQFIIIKEDSDIKRLGFKNDCATLLDIYSYEDTNGRIRYMNDYRYLPLRTAVPNEIMYPLSEIQFEGEVFKAPNDVNSYLRIRFGKWQAFPKSKHEVPGHIPVNEYLNFYPEENEMIMTGTLPKNQ